MPNVPASCGRVGLHQQCAPRSDGGPDAVVVDEVAGDQFTRRSDRAQRRHHAGALAAPRPGSADGTGSRTAGRSGSAPRRTARSAAGSRWMHRVRDRRGRQQRLGVRMARRRRTAPSRSATSTSDSEVHHRDPLGQELHRGQVVGDEQAGEAELGLQPADQVEHRGLHRDVQRRGRLVGDQQRRSGRQRPGQADPLPLPAGQLVRDSGGRPRRAVRPGRAAPSTRAGRLVREPIRCSRNGSPTISATVIRGLSDDAGSWNTMLKSRRSGRSRRRESPEMSVPLIRTVPAGHRHQPGHAPAERGLAAAGLADQPEHLARRDGQADPVHRADRAEVLDQVDDLQRGGHPVHRRRCSGSGWKQRTGWPAGPGSQRRRARPAARRRRTRTGRRTCTPPATSRMRRHPAGDLAQAALGVPVPGWAPPRADRGCTGGCAGRTAPRCRPPRWSRPAYMTTTRSAMSATTPRSWVISRIAVPISVAQVAQHVEDAGLHGHVERGGRLVGDEQPRAGRRPPSRSSPAAACRRRAGAGTRAAAAPAAGCRPARAARPPAGAPPRRACRWWRRSTSPIWRPTVSTGLSEVIGSWKT